MNANEPMRGWYADPFGRYDERYFIDGHYTDRARLFIGSRPRSFHDPIPGALEIDGLEQAPAMYDDARRASIVTIVLVAIGVACLIGAFYLGAFAHVTVGDGSVDCGTAFSPSTTLSTGRTHQCNSAGLTTNRTLAIVLGLAGLGMIVVGVVRRVGSGRLTLWNAGTTSDGVLPEEEVDSDETRTCPWCAETIKSAAVICRFCGRITPSVNEHGTNGGADGFVFDPRRGAWTRADVAAARAAEVDPLVELPRRPTALPQAPAGSPTDVIDVDEE